MPKYELCIVSKEYRYIVIEAEDKNSAIDKAWEEVACGYTVDTKPQDYDTDIYLDCEIKENENA